MSLLEFDYTNAEGEIKRRALTGWAEEGHYVVGNDTLANGVWRTFRKDRITQYFNGCDALLKTPFEAGPPPRPAKSKNANPTPRDDRPQILFTGFGSARRSALEASCDAGGLAVVKSVTQNLVFVCTGPNAGAAKVSKARMQGCYIVPEADLPALLESGVLPDSIVD